MVQSLFICYRCARSWAEQIAFAQRETAIDALMCGHLCVYVCALTLTSSLEMGEVVRFFFFHTREKYKNICMGFIYRRLVRVFFAGQREWEINEV